MFTGALFKTVKRWKEPKCPLTEEWLYSICDAYGMEYQLGLKTKKILIHTTYILQNGNLSESSQSQNDRYCMIPLIQILRAGKFIETDR